MKTHQYFFFSIGIFTYLGWNFSNDLLMTRKENDSIQCNVVILSFQGPSWSWLYDSWIYNYLWYQCLLSLKFWVRTPLPRSWRGVLDTTLCDKVCDRSVVFSGYSGFLHQLNWLPRYNWNIFESGVKHHNVSPYFCWEVPAFSWLFAFLNSLSFIYYY